jgi:hypothetical protein
VTADALPCAFEAGALVATAFNSERSQHRLRSDDWFATISIARSRGHAGT